MTHKHPPRKKGVSRWIDRLTDEQVVALIVRIDRQMADTGMEAGPIRDVLLHFAANMPTGATLPEEVRT